MSDEEREEITKDDADAMLLEWAEWMDLDPDSDLFKDTRDELNYVVRKEKLKFEVEDEVFTYQLLKPVGDTTMVKIRECNFKSKKALDRYKDSQSVEQAMAIMGKYTNLTPLQVEQLKDRDINRINAVILGFLSQTHR